MQVVQPPSLMNDIAKNEKGRTNRHQAALDALARLCDVGLGMPVSRHMSHTRHSPTLPKATNAVSTGHRQPWAVARVDEAPGLMFRPLCPSPCRYLIPYARGSRACRMPVIGIEVSTRRDGSGCDLWFLCLE